jgi:hypothetical protein
MCGINELIEAFLIVENYDNFPLLPKNNDANNN